ncbi:DUF221-domain-containing protein [Trichodelitschia bisporula]|uniref:DUF221-domain-containing protein n=1 Tax=Trichodelitschia bisporula TaxID=703511 RepID=A0A6G1IAJ9_9PEZI|nr:DUF221-domain-containing protein [Trichodelitschia bisporula]
MAFEFRTLQDDGYRKRIVGDPKDTIVQIAISGALGLGAFVAFCILRTRWPSLYAARKRQNSGAANLPDLPNSLLGWIPALWHITEEQVLASAGLDAFVFLAFFKMAIKFLAVTLFFALIVIKPVHDSFPEKAPKHQNKTKGDTLFLSQIDPSKRPTFLDIEDPFPTPSYEADYLWMYLAFAYFFTGLALYMTTTESRRIIDIRQEFLGSQCTVTDKTIRLSGIPHELRSEDKIKKFVEDLEIGKVESVTICRNWKELDDAMALRMSFLRKLEEAWTVFLGPRRIERSRETLPIVQPAPPSPTLHSGDDEQSHLLSGGNGSHVVPYSQPRPTTRIWYGPWKLRYKNVDAIDYYEEKLRRMDEKIKALRQKEFKPSELAFVTMDSVASCQMAVQAVLDSQPLQLLASTSPAPVDVVWPNTYLPRSQRMLRKWAITALICLLTVFWSVVLVPIAGLIDLDRIHTFWPSLAHVLDLHPIIKSLVQTQLPTLVASLLNVLVPYFYDWLANQQGMISQGDVELSVISKNFFFVFFNFFLVFTALGTVALAPSDFGNESPRETANKLALSIQDLRNFYVNYIILQGLGLFPFRLLEFGSVFLYPFSLFGAKTPRDYADVVQPPAFSYGFALPQNILIFLICIVYSVLRSSWQVLLPGLAYFIIGYFVYKYQLLYAMDHSHHSTGKSWIMVCDRIIIGLVIFQISMAGQLALRSAVKRSLGIIPLIVVTVWYGYMYSSSYKPLMTFIALRSIRKAEHADDQGQSIRLAAETRSNRSSGSGDEVRDSGLYFVNPSLVAP